MSGLDPIESQLREVIADSEAHYYTLEHLPSTVVVMARRGNQKAPVFGPNLLEVCQEYTETHELPEGWEYILVLSGKSAHQITSDYWELDLHGEWDRVIEALTEEYK